MAHTLRNVLNQRQGSMFEAAITFEALRAEVLAVRNGQNVRWARGGKMIAVKSNLDWTLLKKGEVACFADSKTFAGRRFGRSMLEPHQLALVERYADFGFVSGFIVHLRELNAVAFYSAARLKTSAVRAGYGIDDGLLLGRLEAFDIAKIWQRG